MTVYNYSIIIQMCIALKMMCQYLDIIFIIYNNWKLRKYQDLYKTLEKYLGIIIIYCYFVKSTVLPIGWEQRL